MPELCRFQGMVIKMLYDDTKQRNKPHVHVYCGEYEASVGIDGEIDIAPETLYFDGIPEKNNDFMVEG